MIDPKYYNIPKEELMDSNFWTNDFYKTAYEKVINKSPIVIPSYNRPECEFLKWFNNNLVAGEEWPIKVVVRESQKELYESSPLIKNNDYIEVVTFEDSKIDDIGKTRQAIVEYFSKTEHFIFMTDDDNTNVSYLVPYLRKSGNRISYSIEKISPGRVFAMWQLAMEKACKIRNDVIMSGITNNSYSWVYSKCDEDKSITYMISNCAVLVALNLDNCKKFNVNYRTIKGNGHDDTDFMVRAILAGGVTVGFRWLAYKTAPLENTVIKAKSLEERFAQQSKEMKDNFSNVDFIKFNKIKANDVELDGVSVDWRKIIKYHNSMDNVDPIKERFYNLRRYI